MQNIQKLSKTLAIITILWYNTYISKLSDYTSLQIVQLPTNINRAFMRLILVELRIARIAKMPIRPHTGVGLPIYRYDSSLQIIE